MRIRPTSKSLRLALAVLLVLAVVIGLSLALRGGSDEQAVVVDAPRTTGAPASSAPTTTASPPVAFDDDEATVAEPGAAPAAEPVEPLVPQPAMPPEFGPLAGIASRQPTTTTTGPTTTTSPPSENSENRGPASHRHPATTKASTTTAASSATQNCGLAVGYEVCADVSATQDCWLDHGVKKCAERKEQMPGCFIYNIYGWCTGRVAADGVSEYKAFGQWYRNVYNGQRDDRNDPRCAGERTAPEFQAVRWIVCNCDLFVDEDREWCTWVSAPGKTRSDHHATTTTTSPFEVRVPNVVGMSPALAYQTLQEAGLHGYENPWNRPETHIVSSQWPRAGVLVEPGSHIDLYFGPPTTTTTTTTTAPPATTEPPSTTAPPATTEPPSTTAPPATTEPPPTTDPPATTEPPPTTDPPATTEPPSTTAPPATTEPPTTSGG